MGKIAQPNTPYCGDFTQGAISAGGQIFTTQNPPISYTLSGKTATISDATGVIGEADLTGKFAEQSNGPASPGVDYCTSKPFARLEWKAGLSDWAINSENPPISYTVELVSESAGYWNIRYTNNSEPGAPTLFFSSPGYEWENATITSAPPGPGCSKTQYSVYSSVSDRYIFKDINCNAEISGVSVVSWTATPEYTVLTSRSDPLPPPRPGDITYTVNVFDSIGQVFSREFSDEPTNFIVRCYDYDITEVKYACEGQCPEAEFECRCEETNTLMCYGWDTNNPDLFKPLFVTSITSG